MQQSTLQNTNGSSEPNHGPGRPTKYNEETVTRLCKALADGMPIKSACAVAGISVQTLSNWRTDDPELEARIEAAKEELRQKALQTIGNAITDGDWRAAEAALKLVFPEYRQNAKAEYAGTQTTVQIGIVCDEGERARLIAMREQITDGRQWLQRIQGSQSQ
jgi:Bacteriophage Sf6, terminase small subunit-like